MSSAIRRACSSDDSGISSSRTIRCAIPSTMAVFPTPGSPIRHRIVLGSSREHLHHAPDLFVTPDHRVDLPVREQRQSDRVQYFSSAWNFPSGSLIGDPLRFPRTLSRGTSGSCRRSGRRFASKIDCTSRSVLAIAEQVVLHRHEVVLQCLRFVLRFPRGIERSSRQARLSTARHPWERFDPPHHRRTQIRHVCAGLLEQRPRDAAVLVEHREQKVLGLKLRISAPPSRIDGVAESVLTLGGHSFGSHGHPKLRP